MYRIIDNNGFLAAPGSKNQMLSFAKRQIAFDPSMPMWLQQYDAGSWFTVKRLI